MGIVVQAEWVAAAQAGRRKWRVPVSPTLAQFGLESGWGKFVPPGSNNPFGIQALAGLPSVAAESKEYREGKLVPVLEHFAAFPSLSDAFEKHAELIATYRPYRYAMELCDEPDEFVEAMAPKYASAPNYSKMLLRIMKSMNLYQYDIPAE